MTQKILRSIAEKENVKNKKEWLFHRIVIEEGANMISLGTVIFGKRKCEEV